MHPSQVDLELVLQFTVPSLPDFVGGHARQIMQHCLLVFARPLADFVIGFPVLQSKGKDCLQELVMI